MGSQRRPVSAVPKRLLREALRAIGIDIGRVRGWAPSHLAQLASPRTVVDVGAAYGTEALHRAFPSARFILFEPLVEYRGSLERLTRDHQCTIHYKALGAREETRQIWVDPSRLTRSSFFARTALTATASTLAQRAIQVTTLDRVLEQDPLIESPVLLKIDTEGGELDVVRGAHEFLKRVEVVILEASVRRRFEGSYSFADIVSEMRGQGFEVFDFLTIRHLPGRPGVKFVDVVFTKREYPDKQ